MVSSTAILEEMQQLELTLLHADHRANPAALEQMLAPEFVEVAPQGHVSERTAVLQWLFNKPATHRWQLSHWQAEALSPTLRLVRYHAVRVEPPSHSNGALHVSLWRFDAELTCWRLHFHQSTKVQ